MTQSLSKLLFVSLGITESQLDRLILRSPKTYKTYPIPKRSGGYRIIAQPAKETKFVQYWLIDNVFAKLKIHKNATAYKKNASITKNAAIHCSNQYLSKFDFSDFFGSISCNALSSFLETQISNEFVPADIEKIARLCCIKHPGRTDLCLSIGAPSSPVLSNAIMYDFDERISAWCDINEVSYSRYADDLTFSTNVKHRSYEIENEIAAILSDLGELRLTLNQEKTVHLSKKFQRRITGLVINNEKSVSLGRARKREISALIHKYLLNELPAPDTFRLQGLLGFAADAEPAFVSRMSQKYGNQLIEKLFKLRTQKSATILEMWDEKFD